MIAKILLGMTLTTAVVMKDGIIEVNVQEHREGGSHVHLFVPATVATWGVHLAPEQKLREHLRGKTEALALAQAVLRDLEKVPDAVLLEVESPKEHVRMEIRGGSFLLDADDKGDTVHIAMPIRAVRKVVEDLQAGAPPNN